MRRVNLKLERESALTEIARALLARLAAAHVVGPHRLEGQAGKNDMTAAAAACEAAWRPSLRFVPIKTTEQQGVMTLRA